MKICFPYKVSDNSGGPSAFIRNFYKFSQRKGLDITCTTKERCDVLFILVAASQELCERKKMEGTKIVLRIDNIYHDKSIDFERYNRPIRDTLEFADFVVFQSHFSKLFVERYFGKIEKPQAVIHNGVDNTLFNPLGPKVEFPFKVNLLTLCRWHPERRLHEAIRIMKGFGNSRVGLVVAGGFKVNDPTILDVRQRLYADKLDLSYSRIHLILNETTSEEVPTLLRSGALFLYPSFRDSCPNVVIEALSCGLPVVAERAGGIPEVVQDGGIIVDPPEEDDFSPINYQVLEEIPKVNVDLFVEAIEKALTDRDYSKLARERAEELSYMKMGEKYLSVFKSLIE